MIVEWLYSVTEKMADEKSRREQRKEARQAKAQQKHQSWMKHQVYEDMSLLLFFFLKKNNFLYYFYPFSIYWEV